MNISQQFSTVELKFKDKNARNWTTFPVGYINKLLTEYNFVFKICSLQNVWERVAWIGLPTMSFWSGDSWVGDQSPDSMFPMNFLCYFKYILQLSYEWLCTPYNIGTISITY